MIYYLTGADTTYHLFLRVISRGRYNITREHSEGIIIEGGTPGVGGPLFLAYPTLRNSQRNSAHEKGPSVINQEAPERSELSMLTESSCPLKKSSP